MPRIDPTAHTRPMGRAPFREHPNASEALALDVRLFGNLRKPSAFGLAFDVPPPLKFSPREWEDPDTGVRHPSSFVAEGIAALRVSGPLEHHSSSWWASYEDIVAQSRAALVHGDVKKLALRIDSPGGVVSGMDEAHKALLRLQKETGKTISAFVDEQACSAAYGLASACKGGIYLPSTGHAGSIGVILCTVDETKALDKAGIRVRYVVTGQRKADMHPGAPITDAVLRTAQAKVDQLGEIFFASVSKARGLSPKKIRGYEAAVFLGKDAVSAGLADGVMGWEEFLDFLRGNDRASKLTDQSVSPGASRPDRGTSRGTMGNKTKTAMIEADEKQKGAIAQALGVLAAAFGLGGEAKPEGRMQKHTVTTKRVETMEDDEPSDADDDEKEDADAMDSSTDQAEDEDSGADAEGDDEDADAENKAAAVAHGRRPAATLGRTAHAPGRSAALKAANEAAERAFRSALPPEHAASLGLFSPRAVRHHVKRATGAKSLDEALMAVSTSGRSPKGADASAEAVRKQAEIEARTARLEQDNRKRRVDEIVAAAKAEGRAGATTSEGRANLRAHGMAHGTKSLRGLLATLPIVARTTEREPRIDEHGSPIGAPARDEQARMLDQMTAGLDEKQKAAFLADLNARMMNGAARPPRS